LGRGGEEAQKINELSTELKAKFPVALISNYAYIVFFMKE
jgi:hypothetical protein